MTEQFDWDRFAQADVVNWLVQQSEYYLAGFIEAPAVPLLIRMAKGLRMQLERCVLPEWNGEALYPSGMYSIWDQGSALVFSYSFPLTFLQDRWKSKTSLCKDDILQEQLEALGERMLDFSRLDQCLAPQYRLGGCGYTHSIPDYTTVIQEGFEKIAEKVHQRLYAATMEEADSRTFYQALEEVLAGFRTYHQRLLQALAGGNHSQNCLRVVKTLEQVPWKPARNFYEGLVAFNLVYYLDGCDNPGRFDQVLGGLYATDLDTGNITTNDGEILVRQFWENVNANTGWNCALGGSTTGGKPAYNSLTVTSLKAACGIRRPNMALRVRPDMPDDVWEATLDTLASGCGLPALYNDPAYLNAIRKKDLIPEDDIYDFAFGGCTELMVHGKSSVGSLDGGINLLRVLNSTLTHILPIADSFDEVMKCFKQDLALEIKHMTHSISKIQRVKAERQPQLIRSILIRDCIERGVDFHAGGARYNWSVVNIGGLPNVVDSLAAVRQMVFEEEEVSGLELQDALVANFAGYELLRKQLSRCPHYGNDDPRADKIAEEISAYVFNEFGKYTPWRGGKFLPGCLLFVTYADAGLDVGATPDGRLANTPIADSAGPVAGRDRNGPTAMMRSVSHLDWQNAPGTLVVNVRLNPEMFKGQEQRQRTRALLQSYFNLGNMQLQVNVVDQEILEAAIKDPESYRDLVVRVGGYSEYFIALSPALRQTILERTIHGAD